MTVRYYLSTDPGAPTLNGVAASEIAVLKACLVTGYGTQIAAGWTEEFSSANKSVLRAAAGNRHFFRIEDSFGQYASLKGYLAMTGVDTGTDPFPGSTTYQYHRKSSVADASSRAWMVVANEKAVYMISQNDLSANWDNAQLVAFGEFRKARASWPALNSFVWGASVTTGGTDCVGVVDVFNATTVTSGFATSMNINGGVAATTSRRRTPVNTAIFEGGTRGSTMSSHTAAPIPALLTGQLLTSEIGAYSTLNGQGESCNYLGTLPGVREFLHSKPVPNMDTIAGAGDMAGKTFVAVNCGAGASQVLLEISDTWEP